MVIIISKLILLIWRLINCLSEMFLFCGNGNDEVDIFRFFGKIYQCIDRMVDISLFILIGV